MTSDRPQPPSPQKDKATHDYHQGKAHVSNAEEAERRARQDAAEQRGKTPPEGQTPGGVSS